MSDKSGSVVSFGTVRITHLDSADDAVIFADTIEVLSEALVLLREEAKPLGLRVCPMKTKVQAFDDILDAITALIPVSCENKEVTQTFPYIGSIHSSTSWFRGYVDHTLK